MPGIDWYLTELYATMVRFGLWDEMLAEAPPNPKLAGLAAGYLYARTAAFAAKGRIEEAKTDLQALEKINAATTADDSAGLNAARDMFTVAVLVARARIAAAEGRSAEAIALLTDATAKEDVLAYDEPSDWFVPVRHLLGAALLRAGKEQEAEAVYREDLRRHPDNGWALYGLTQSLAAQHKDNEAQDTRRRFDAAWKDADVEMTNSAF
jgi:tetratricopeptide (TPR) repeat protein